MVLKIRTDCMTLNEVIALDKIFMNTFGTDFQSSSQGRGLEALGDDGKIYYDFWQALP